MVEAYLDESGIHEGAHICVIAGFFGGKQQWRGFEPRWRKIIQDADDRFTEFHSTDFWKPDGTRKGRFARWPDSKAEKFINDLLSCITDYRLYPVSASLKIAAWRKLNKAERMFLTGGRIDVATGEWITPSAPNQTYFLPFQFCVMTPALYCKSHLKVNYFFDLNKQFKHHATELFRLMKHDSTLSCRGRLGTLELRSSQEMPGLQAADLFAYQSYQYGKIRLLTRQPVVGTLPPVLRTMLANFRNPQDFPFFDEEGLGVAVANMPSEMRGN